jgi:hypothetical protein
LDQGRGFSHDGAREFRQAEDPELSLHSGPKRVRAGDALAGQDKQMAALDAQELGGLVCRYEPFGIHDRVRSTVFVLKFGSRLVRGPLPFHYSAMRVPWDCERSILRIDFHTIQPQSRHSGR